jgi:TRAP-type C4-dicarboxylate transport system permease small subunit
MSASERVAMAAAVPGDLASRLDRAFGLALEIGTALLVVAEIAILFVGIVARYAFHHPLIWSDELASLLFLWLAMLGTVLALRRGEHMRMTALVNSFPPRFRSFFELLSLAAALAFLGAILLPAFDYAASESIVSIMSLDISMSWRAGAMPAGIALLGLTVLLRILAQPKPATLLALIVIAVLIGAFAFLHPTLLTLGRGNLIVFFLGVVSVSVFAGIPIAVSFGLATLGYLAFATHVPIAVLVARMDSGCRIRCCCQCRCSCSWAC